MPSPLEDLGRRFLGYAEGVTPHFRHSARPVDLQARQYLRGLIQARRKNMERMVEVVPSSDYQALQHFLSNSKWNARAVMDQVGDQADEALGGFEDSCLLIDETSFPKKGEKSVGVARQWCGRLGKVENCQVAVFASLSRGSHSGLIDTRLYLPKEWVNDVGRCREAKIPEAKRVRRSKAELALEMVQHARAQGRRFRWVGADGAYGKDPMFLRSLADSWESFVVDVHESQAVYLEDPQPAMPERRSCLGRALTRLCTAAESQRVEEWARRQPRRSWKRIRIRDSTEGVMRLDVLHRHVWLWDGQEKKARYWRLIVTREVGSKHTLKYGLSNVSSEVSLRELAQMHRQRYWIERSFQDAKSECGMGEYQARGWVAWHHHMALVMMAMQYLLEERLRQKDCHELLSCADVVQLLVHTLPRQDVTLEEVVRQMEVRHKQRREAIDSAYRAQDRDEAHEVSGLRDPTPI